MVRKKTRKLELKSRINTSPKYLIWRWKQSSEKMEMYC
jgi:hypothetical protein